MSLIGLLVVLVIIGVGLYLLNQYVPMAAPIKTIINVVVILVVIIWLLQAFGVFTGTIPRIR
jgi:uncharacterized protein YhhL (DUF1145 family)